MTTNDENLKVLRRAYDQAKAISDTALDALGKASDAVNDEANAEYYKAEAEAAYDAATIAKAKARNIERAADKTQTVLNAISQAADRAEAASRAACQAADDAVSASQKADKAQAERKILRRKKSDYSSNTHIR